MKHEFTDSEITVAADHAVDTTSYYRTIPIDYHQAFLDALPEPQDEWEACAFDEVKDTDLKVRVEYGNWAIEGKPYVQNDAIGIKTGDGYYAQNFFYVHISDEVNLYRIPAPVQHPDPEEHPVILVTEYDVAGNIIECEPTPFFAHDGVYKNDSYAHRPDDVLSWSPAKVVADDEM